jgi:hypothetical protein
VASAELRRIFNDDRLWERAQSGEFSERVLKSGHPAPKRSGEPFCTESQIVGYFDQAGRRKALVHQYLRPNGSIGGRGQPDPKAVFKDGILFVATVEE